MPPARARLRRPAALLVVLALLAVAVPAAAEPDSGELRHDLQRAEQRLDEIEERVSAVVEDYNEAQVALDEATERLETARAELETLTADREALTDIVVDHARQLHKLGPTVELSAALATGGPTDAGARLAVLRRILDGRRADLQDLEAVRTAQAAVEERLAEARADAEERKAELEQRREELEATIEEHETEVAELRRELQEAIEREEAERRRQEAEERRRRQEAEERRQQAEQREAEQRQAEQAAARSEPQETSSTAQSAPATRRSAQVAVDTALAQLGKPYRWGGNGPNAFDCSGLTRFAWRAAGVELPRTSRAQYAGTTRISRDQLQPGDLVFYHSPISHVAMYIGGGRVVEAPYSGNSVRIREDGLTRRGIVGYGRP